MIEKTGSIGGSGNRIYDVAAVAEPAAVLAWISLAGAVVLFCWQLTHRMRRGGRGHETVGGGGWAYVVAVACAVGVLVLAVGMADWLTELVLGRRGWAADLATIVDPASLVAAAAGIGGAGQGVDVTAAGFSVAGQIYRAEMILRQMLISLLIPAIPVAVDLRAAPRWAPRVSWVIRWTLVAILVKPILTLALVVGVSEVGPVGGVTGLVGSVSVLVFLVCCPLTLFRFLAFVVPNVGCAASARVPFASTSPAYVGVVHDSDTRGWGRSSAAGRRVRDRTDVSAGAVPGGARFGAAVLTALARGRQRCSGRRGVLRGDGTTPGVSPVVREIPASVGLLGEPAGDDHTVGDRGSGRRTGWRVRPRVSPPRRAAAPAAQPPPPRRSRANVSDDAGAGLGRPPVTRWALAILGRPTLLAVRANSEAVDVTGRLSPKMLDLVVLLALHPHGIRRDPIVAALWPDTDRRRPANNLAALITRLRAAVRQHRSGDPDGPSAPTGGTTTGITGFIKADGDRYHLDPTLISVDYWTFLAAASIPSPINGQHSGGPDRDDAAVDAREELQALQRAHELYRGSLADGLDAEWVVSVREAARRRYLAMTARLVRHHVPTAPTVALALLETARNLDPVNENLYRDIIALQLRAGDNDGAANTLRLLETQLADIDETISAAAAALARNLHATRVDQWASVVDEVTSEPRPATD